MLCSKLFILSIGFVLLTINIIYIIKSKPCLLVTEQYCQLLIVKCCNWVQYSLHTRHYSGAALREAPLCAVNSFACIQRRPRHAKDIVKFLTNNQYILYFFLFSMQNYNVCVCVCVNEGSVMKVINVIYVDCASVKNCPLRSPIYAFI